jgi:uncharacterized protein YjbI with pentapeptide repeats
MKEIKLSNEEDLAEEVYLPPRPQPQPGHSIWNRLLILLLILTIAMSFLWTNIQDHQNALLISQQEQNTQLHIADEQQRETLLQNYMKSITDFLTQDKLLTVHAKDDPAKIAADTLTRTTLSRLDPMRKAQLMKFLYLTKLINNDSISIDMQGVDVSKAQMANIDLRDTEMLGVNMSDTDLHGAILSDAILAFANLAHANLAKADFHACDMRNTNLTGANLAGANLRDVIGLNNTQLSTIKSLKGATMPDGSVHP